MATRKALWTVDNNRVRRCKWSGLLNGDDGSLEQFAHLSEITLVVRGTFGVGGTIILEDADGNVLRDPQGTALSFTAKNTKVVLEKPQEIRPRVTAGDGSTNLEGEITGKPDMG
jgi:hypothetical protein